MENLVYTFSVVILFVYASVEIASGQSKML